MKRRSLFIAAVWCVLALLVPQTASAHGGVIVDGGLTEEYEWLIAVSPYPATPGDTVLTLLIYELESYAPVNGLDTALYLTPPDSSERTGPFDLLADPEQYPGDYSNIFDIDQEGAWGVAFEVNLESETLLITSTVTVQPGNPNDPRPTAEGAADVAATATVFAQNVADARQTGDTTPISDTALNSPLTTTGNSGSAVLPDAELSTTPESPSNPPPPVETAYPAPAGNTNPLALAFSRNPWLWLLVGALPFILLFLWFLRAPPGNALNADLLDEEFDEVDDDEVDDDES